MVKPIMDSGPDVERLRHLLHYNPDTGAFTWLVSNSPIAKVGNEAGCIQKTTGYILIGIDGRLHRAHRLAWYYVHGKWPYQIDHINGIKGDNRVSNLRECSSSQNAQNIGARANNGSGYKGITATPEGRWMARIAANGRRQCLGTFATKEEAHAAYSDAAQRLHGEFARAA